MLLLIFAYVLLVIGIVLVCFGAVLFYKLFVEVFLDSIANKHWKWTVISGLVLIIGLPICIGLFYMFFDCLTTLIATL